MSEGAAHAPHVEPARDRYRVIRRVTLIGSVVDAGLGVAKLMVGWLAQSQALIADGVHSLSDLATDVLVLVAARHASAEADDDHPYGHARIETAATVALGLSLVMVAVGIAFDAIRRMLHPELLMHPQAWAIWVAVVSVVAKELVYRYTMLHARRLRSSLLEANAWHSRSDAMSSLVVMVGLGGTMMGLEYVDAVAAVVVAWMIGRMGIEFAWHSMRELVDTGLTEDRLAAIRAAILSVDGVGALHELRSRRMGSNALVDVHIILADPRVSVSEGHQISDTVRFRVIRAVDEVTDVMVHIDPEDDEDQPLNVHLPSRTVLLDRLREAWRGIEPAQHIESIGLHYLSGRIDVEVRVPPSLVADAAAAAALRAALAEALRDEPVVRRVSLMVAYRPGVPVTHQIEA